MTSQSTSMTSLVVDVIRRIPWKRLSKIYGVFAVFHVFIKFMRGVMYIRRGSKGFEKLPGRNCEPLGKEIPEAMLRLHDWKADQILKYPNADWVTIAETMPTVCAASPMAVEFILKHSFDTVSKFGEKEDVGTRFFKQFIGEGFFSLRNGDASPNMAREHGKWFAQRKSLVRVFTQYNIGKMGTTVGRKTHELIDILTERNVAASTLGVNKAPPVVDIQELIFQLTMDVSQYVLLGRIVNTLGGSPDRMAVAFDESHRMFWKYYLTNIVPLTFGGLLPWPLAPWWDTSGYNTIVFKYLNRTSPMKARFDDSRHELRRETSEIVNYLRAQKHTERQGQTGKETPNKNMASLLLENESLSTQELVDIVLSLVIAGRDTTACLLSWTIYELTQNPEVQKQLCEEVDKAFGNRRTADGKAFAPTQQDVSATNMPYLNGVIYEALRKWPPVPDDDKIFAKDTVLPGDMGVAKAGMKVFYHPYSMGRNPSRWPEPMAIKPERWIPFKNPSPYEFPVFQGGPRSCLGKDLAIFEAKVVIAMLVQEFTFELKEGQQELIRPALALTMAVANSVDLKSEALLVHAMPRRSV